MSRTLIAMLWCTLFIAALTPTTNARAADPPLQRAFVDDPAVVGQWGDVMPWPDKAVHMTMLHTGKVLWYRGEGSDHQTNIWDPVTLEMQHVPFPDNIFCSGASVNADGTVLVSGGRISGSEGPKHTFVFDPIALTWTRGPDMREGRYYPTHVRLGDGRTVLVGGYDENEVENEMVEIYVPGGGPGGTDRIDLVENGDHFMAYYPRMHLLPSGKIFHVGKEPESETFDPVTGAWTPVAESNHGSRRDGTAMMLPGGFSKFMILSGGTETVEVIDLDDPVPTWRYVESMTHSRLHANNLILPNAKVLVSGGEDGSTLIYPAEIFDPETETWQVVASMHTWRVYHSSAVLLPDGRCLWAGADGNHTAEIYSPPYLFRGPRPVIDSAPASIEYGETFTIGTPNATEIASACLIRLSASTHSTNMEQRYIPLAYDATDANTLTAVAPSEPNKAPAGYYYLFISNGDEVPAIAKIVNIGGEAAALPNRAPIVDAGPDQLGAHPATLTLNGSVVDDGLPDPPASVDKTWTKISGPGTVDFVSDKTAVTNASFSDIGTYYLSLTGFDGEFTVSDTMKVDVRDPSDVRVTIKSRIAAANDDAEERPGGSVSTSSSDLELVFDGGEQTVGLRFTGLDIPAGATINSAYLQFTADESQSEATSLDIFGHDADVATPLGATISGLPRTTEFVNWQPAAWTPDDSSAAQKSPDLAAVVQEVVDRTSFSGNALTLIISGTGHRTAVSYDGDPDGAPVLCIEYGIGPRPNRAPIVDAGPDQTIEIGESVMLRGTATDDGLPDPPASLTEFWDLVSGPASVAYSDRTSSETEVGFTDVGTYRLSLTCYDGEYWASDTVTVEVEWPCFAPSGLGLFADADPIIVDRQIASGDDDVEERAGGRISTSSSDLELVNDGGNQTIGLRFDQIVIPQGAKIATAYLQFTADESQTEPTTLTIQAHDVGSAPAFTTANGDVSLRDKTSNAVTWTPGPWSGGDQGDAQKSPELKDIIQELVDRGDWSSTTLVIIISGTGHRTAESFDGLPAGAARLYIETDVACTYNRPPTADAGENQTITLPVQATLAGLVQDDGLPNVPGVTTARWNKVSGPGDVTFGVETSATTTASFSRDGSYILSLTAFDGEHTDIDSVGINVREAVINDPPSVDAGPDQTITLPEGLSLAGVARDDNLPLPLTAEWKQVSGPGTVFFANEESAFTAATVSRSGEYVVSLTAFDGEYTRADSATITVLPDPNANEAPMVDAGSDLAIDHDAVAHLQGTASDDGKPAVPGTLVTTWRQLSGPGVTSFVDSLSAETHATFSASGTYLLSLTAYDGEFAVSDSASIEVGDPPVPNTAPEVDVHADLFIELGESAHVSGDTNDDGLPNPPGALVCTWRQLSGPAPVTFADSMAAATEVGFIAAGTYLLSLTCDDSELTGADSLTVTVREPCVAGGLGLLHEPAPIIVERLIASGDDDVEQRASGSISVSSSDLELVFDGGIQTIGLRFTQVEIPQGAVIGTAYIQFMADESQSELTTLTLHAQDADSAEAFTTANSDVSLRPKTSTTVTWTPAAWTAGDQGAAQKTPDLKEIIQEVVDRTQWASTTLAIIITGTGHRTAESFNGNPSGAARLYIETEAGCAQNRPPTADAGPDQTITLPASAVLAGSIHDDGLPHPPDLTTADWNKVSGPGTVLFIDETSAHTSASFSQAGTYIVSLTAFDGQLSVSDSATITVREAGTLEPQVRDASVAASSDDAEEDPSGSISLSSSDLELVDDGELQVVGVRFTGLDIPSGSIITKAHIQFEADEAQTVETILTITGHDHDDAPSFGTSNGNISLRDRTSNSVEWRPEAWVRGNAGSAQQTDDLSAVIQEIVGRSTWGGNTLVFIFEGIGHRTAESFDGSGAPARLHVEFDAPATLANKRATDFMQDGARIAITQLGPVYPNPAKGSATVQFQLARETDVTIEVFDLRGARVRTIVQGTWSAGLYSERWDGRDHAGRRLADGVYLLRFAADGHRETRKMVIMR